MSNIIIPPGWRIPEHEATPESDFINRRSFMRKFAAFGTLAVGGSISACGKEESATASDPFFQAPYGYPATRNRAYTIDRPLTDENVAAGYNNYYEFTSGKGGIGDLSGDFRISPWSIEVSGEVNNPKEWDFHDLLAEVDAEERLYRHRCVEAWAMAVPWTGFPFADLIALADPTAKANYVKMTTANYPSQMQNVRNNSHFPWPYVEALRIEEAANPLAFLATGIYGHEMPKQHGAPIRLVAPWKYGFKSIKSIVKIEFVETQPVTFWPSAEPTEYFFEANVNPVVPHPRWSQTTEVMIGSRDIHQTQPFNGYGEYVANLY